MKRRRKRKRTFIMVPVASMGDIAFLLIIFFMVTSQIARQRQVVKPPRSLDTEKLKTTPVTVTIDADGTYFLQGERVSGAEELGSRLEAMLRTRTRDAQRTVLFRCDRSVPNDTFEPAVDAIVQAGGLLGLVGEHGEPVGARQ